MATDSKILREYLLSLGFKVDAASSKKFDWTLGKLDLRVAGLASAVYRVVTGTNEMVTQFARGMERMYYASVKAQSSAGNLAAIGYGAKQIGLTSEGMVASIEGIARALRLNPGLHGLVESFGVQVKGRDMSVVAQDLYKVLAKMPHYIGAQYAGLFGISPDDLLLLGKNADKLDKLMAEHKQMVSDAGLDLDKATEAGVQYANTLDRIAGRFDLLKKALSLRLLPLFKDMAYAVEDVLEKSTKLLTSWQVPGYVKEHAGDGFLDGLKYLASGQAAQDAMDFAKGKGSGGRKAVGVVTSESISVAAGAMTRATSTIDETLRALLPKVLKQESGGRRYGDDGKLLTSRAGAKGEMQVLDGTMNSPGYGVVGARDNSADERARVGRDYLRAMLVKYGGDAALALAAYNGGPGHLDKALAGKSKMLPETYDYVQRITGQPLVLNTTVNVHGAGDPKATGATVAKAVNDTNSAILRNLQTVNY